MTEKERNNIENLINELIREAITSPEWTAVCALRCLKKEIKTLWNGKKEGQKNESSV